MAENFDTIDVNSDGFIDLDELQSGKKKKPNVEQFMKDIDANEDGNLDELEVAASENLAIKNNFSKIDTNEDGFISKNELENFFSKGKKRKKNKK
jgi:Ca2+-binding EF-hand superfamily protein